MAGIKECIELAVLETQKEWLSKKGVEYTLEDLDEFIDNRFDGGNVE